MSEEGMAGCSVDEARDIIASSHRRMPAIADEPAAAILREEIRAWLDRGAPLRPEAAAIGTQEHSVEMTLSVAEAGRRYFGLSRTGAYTAAERGELPAIRVGGRLRVSKAACEAMLEEMILAAVRRVRREVCPPAETDAPAA